MNMMVVERSSKQWVRMGQRKMCQQEACPLVIANELLYSWKGFESGIERGESAISSHVR
jgi:hypothetical protein